MPVNFGQFTETTTLGTGDYIIGYTPGAPSVEKRITLSNLAGAVATSQSAQPLKFIRKNLAPTGSTSLPNGFGQWISAAYGNGRWVVVSSGGNSSAWSLDGVEWTYVAMPNAANYRVAYGNGRFVAVSKSTLGGPSTIGALSTDGGATWSSITLPRGEWASIAFGGGVFVAVQNENTAATAIYSTDGNIWTTTPITGAFYTSVTYGNGKFVAVADGSLTVSYSTDGINWSSSTLASFGWDSVVAGQDKFVAIITNSATIATSTDGITWVTTSNALPSASSWEHITYFNGMYLVVASSLNKYAYSYDAVTWYLGNLPGSYTWSHAAFGGGVAIVLHNSTSVTNRDYYALAYA